MKRLIGDTVRRVNGKCVCNLIRDSLVILLRLGVGINDLVPEGSQSHVGSLQTQQLPYTHLPHRRDLKRLDWF